MRHFKVFVLGLLLALSVLVQTTTAQYLPTDARALNGTRVPFLHRQQTNQRPFLWLNRSARLA